MWDAFKKYFLHERGLAVVSVFFWLLSLALIVSAPGLGVAFTAKDGARGFLQKPNWYLFPLFFPVMMWLANNTWYGYLAGWKSLLTEGVLHTDEYRRVPRDDFGRLARLMRRARFVLLVLACVLGLALTTIDSRSSFHLFSSKADTELANPCTDRDFTIAAKIPEYFPSASWTSTIWFAAWAYLMQGALLALGFLCLLQILFHGVLFSFFEKMGLARKLKLGILLRIDDPNREFGLSTWNNAINQGYIFLAFGMGIPLVSHFSQPFNRPELRTCSPSTGQHLFGFFLWTILAAPTILPVLARFARLRKAQEIVRAANDPTVTDTFEKQRLWPWDKWDVGKLFLGLSFLEYLLIANIIDVQKAFDFIVKRFGG